MAHLFHLEGRRCVRCRDRRLSLSSIVRAPMATKKLRPVHPGDILLHDFMQPLKLSPYRVAKELGVTAPTVNEIVRWRRAITAQRAVRLSRFFGTSTQLWQNLQTQYDLEIASKKSASRSS